MISKDAQTILSVQNLKVTSFSGAELVRDISLSIKQGEIVGLVGESGSGKSISAMAIAGLLPEGISVSQGQVVFQNEEITYLKPNQRKDINGKRIGIIYQDASQALNPLMRIGQQIGEVLKIHHMMKQKERKARVIGTMKAVNLPNPEELYNRYPHELSGGQRQRVLIAMAIINNPELLIADEPTTALDATVRTQILDLIQAINQSKQNSILYISHDLSTVKKLCDRVYVLYAGMVVEIGSTEQIIKHPQHVYTQQLLASIPTKEKRGKILLQMKPKIKDLRGPAKSCLFAERCPYAMDVCWQKIPPMYQVEEGHQAACFLIKKEMEVTLDEQ